MESLDNNQWLLQANSKLQNYQAYIDNLPEDKTKTDHQSSKMILVSLLDHAPNDGGRGRVAREIALCSDNDALQRLGVYYRRYLIGAFKATGGRTPAPTDHPSRDSAEFERQHIGDMLIIAKRDSTALKKLSLKRDNFRCLVTNALDLPSWRKVPRLGSIADGDYGRYTEAAHILPFSLCSATDSVQLENKAAVWAVIQTFSGIQLDEVNGDQINRLDNVLTLQRDYHQAFGGLELWFEPVEDQINTYRLRKVDNLLDAAQDGQTIVFTSAVPELEPLLPKREFLALHAACAKVAHASGAAEEIDEFWRDWEETKVLAADGSSSRLLEEALLYQIAGISVH